MYHKEGLRYLDVIFNYWSKLLASQWNSFIVLSVSVSFIAEMSCEGWNEEIAMTEL